MRGFLFTLLLSVSTLSVIAQTADYEPNQFLIQLSPNHTIEQLNSKLKAYDSNIHWKTPKRLIPKMEIWQLEYTGNSSPIHLLEFLNSISFIQTAQFNHKVELRSPAPNATTPNDPLFNNQWQYINTGVGGGTAGVDLDADLAWDITTGGLTATNDTIVVAVLDNGVNPNQSDFGTNLWVNRSEIPNNNIDDDNNGYEDDYLGWNSTTNSDLISGGGHGTSVAGIIGAKGNNGSGVTGVNWNVKLMIINNNWNVNEAKVLEAYGYALTQRRIYNQTNGQEGAFVVATNASWGMNNGQPANAPLWCAFYDTLGAYGILNVAATANSNVDVDVVGDLPTACPSDYLVAVTNVNKLGYKEMAAAYGSTSIDLGAFGSGVYTTISPSGYGTFGGTSGASPHVAGAVALLYSGACNNFMVYSKVYPDSAALKMKEYLLTGVVPIVDLNGTTVSGGYLNLFNSLNLCINDCPTSTCFAPYQIYASNVIDTQAQLNWTYPSTVNQLKYRYKEQGGSWSAFSTVALNQASVVLHNLLACTFYDVQLLPVCGGIIGDTTNFSFKTDGCCEAPSGLNANIIKEDSAQISWQTLLAGNTYMLSYKEAGTSTWLFIPNLSSPNTWLENLNPCTYYDVRLQAICQSGDTTMVSNTLSFVTLGCTSCNVVSYCAAKGNNAVDDWIDTFSVDYYVNASGNDTGYAFFETVGIYLGKGDYHNISISQGKTFVEFVKIWLDIDQNGDFLGPDEELYSGVMGITDTTIHGSIIVPPTALLGVTRMRVAMRWNNLPPQCGTFDFGEVEDYCVQIIPGNAIPVLPKNIRNLYVYPNPFSDNIQVEMELANTLDLNLAIYSTTGQLVHAEYLADLTAGEQKIVLNPVLPNGVYFLKIESEAGQVTQRIVKMN